MLVVFLFVVSVLLGLKALSVALGEGRLLVGALWAVAAYFFCPGLGNIFGV